MARIKVNKTMLLPSRFRNQVGREDEKFATIILVSEKCAKMYFWKRHKVLQRFEGGDICIREGFVEVVLEGQFEHRKAFQAVGTTWEKTLREKRNICCLLLCARHCTKALHMLVHLICTITLYSPQYYFHFRDNIQTPSW